ncbi:MAG: hypothetical protein LAQ69_39620 [Acidobacteriia bacterium]|nr:hypothetical protein [Terriglobia bacterium]
MMRGDRDQGRDYVVTHVNTVNSGAAFPMRAIQNQHYSLIFSPWSDGKLRFQAESMIGLTYKALKGAAERDSRIAARVNNMSSASRSHSTTLQKIPISGRM